MNNKRASLLCTRVETQPMNEKERFSSSRTRALIIIALEKIQTKNVIDFDFASPEQNLPFLFRNSDGLADRYITEAKIDERKKKQNTLYARISRPSGICMRVVMGGVVSAGCCSDVQMCCFLLLLLNGRKEKEMKNGEKN